MRLYEIVEQYQEVEAELINSGGEITPEIEALLASINDNLENKAANYIRIIKNFEHMAQGLKEEIARLQARRKVHENAAERLKGALLYALKSMGERSVETSLGRVTAMQASTPKYMLKVDLEDLPEEFIRTKREVDMSAIREAIKDGMDLTDLVQEEERTEYVRII